jgi:uncharacterized protein (TIGR02001 family)
MKTLHKTAISAAAVALLSGLATSAAFAEEAAAEAPEASPITANVTVVNDYRYRGLTQSNFKPAIQGGFDYAHESGFYIGNWNSSISWISDSYPSATASVSAPIEMDFYAGFKKELIAEGFASDIGVLQYAYPAKGLPSQTCGSTSVNSASRQSCGANPNTTEVYAAQNFTFGPVSGFAKLSYAISNIFGFYQSSGSYYPDLTLNYDTGIWGVTLNGHVGYQHIAKSTSAYNYSYTDWKLGLTKDFGGGLSGAVAYVSTTAGKVGNTPLYYTPQNKNMGAGGGLVSLTKTF